MTMSDKEKRFVARFIAGFCFAFLAVDLASSAVAVWAIGSRGVMNWPLAFVLAFLITGATVVASIAITRRAWL